MGVAAATWIVTLSLLLASGVRVGRAYEETENVCVVATIPQHLMRGLSVVAVKLKNFFPPPPPLDMTNVTDGVAELANKMDDFRLKIVKSISTSINESSETEANVLNVTRGRSEEVASIILSETVKTKKFLHNLSNLSTLVGEMYRDIGELEVQNAELINGIVSFLDNESVVPEGPEVENLPVAAMMDLLALQETQQVRLRAVLHSIELQENERSPATVNNITREIEKSKKTMQERRRRLQQENESIQKVIQQGVNVGQRPRDCWDHFRNGETKSDVYTIFPERCSTAASAGVRVWCDMDVPRWGGGWTVLLSRNKKLNRSYYPAVNTGETSVESDVRYEGISYGNQGGNGFQRNETLIQEARRNGSHEQQHGENKSESQSHSDQNETSSKWENFTRSWTDYEAGFGAKNGEHFLGLRWTHLLTQGRRYSLLLLVEGKGGRRAWGKWGRFGVAGRTSRYALQVGHYSALSSVPDVLASHNRQRFSTFDDDNDASYSSNCAELYGGGWWYGRCYDVNPTGVWEVGDPSTRGVVLGRTTRVDSVSKAQQRRGNSKTRTITAAVVNERKRGKTETKATKNKIKPFDGWKEITRVMATYGDPKRERKSESSRRSRQKRSNLMRLAPVAELKLLIRPVIEDKVFERQGGSET